ncbi:MAG: TIGR01777 family oxidoreductase [Methylococcaceae bacterium]|nr:TIGR01777 family oxidoreductase [Methylococcaceae bacterium]
MTSKNILITGGTGFLGSALVGDWLEQGHSVTVLTRNPAAAKRLLGSGINAVPELIGLPTDTRFDAIVNLAGEPIFGARWTDIRKRRLRDSRIALTERLVSFIDSLPEKPEVLISGSAIGVYGDQGDTVLTENSGGKPCFSQQLCLDWENAARQAEQLGIRVCLVRTGLVLDQGGGLLQRMLPAFRLGMGGRLGEGRQWMSWIHRRDWLAIVHTLLNNPDLQGAFNATAPQPVTNQAFSDNLAKRLHRPSLLPMPTTLLKLLFGEMAELMLGSQRVMPARLQEQGFEFQFPTLEAALQQILGHD